MYNIILCYNVLCGWNLNIFEIQLFSPIKLSWTRSLFPLSITRTHPLLFPSLLTQRGELIEIQCLHPFFATAEKGSDSYREGDEYMQPEKMVNCTTRYVIHITWLNVLNNELGLTNNYIFVIILMIKNMAVFTRTTKNLILNIDEFLITWNWVCWSSGKG